MAHPAMGLVDWYLGVKARASRERLARDKPLRRPLPPFASPEDLANWMTTYMVYTGDGPRVTWSPSLRRWIGIGFPDLYTHPEVIVAAVDARQAESVESDCDDFALVAWRGLQGQAKINTAMPVSQINIVTLVAGNPIRQSGFPWLYWPSHVICAFERWDTNLRRYRLGVIDPAGLQWFDDLPQAVTHFGKANGTAYTAVVTAWPFEGVA